MELGSDLESFFKANLGMGRAEASGELEKFGAAYNCLGVFPSHGGVGLWSMEIAIGFADSW